MNPRPASRTIPRFTGFPITWERCATTEQERRNISAAGATKNHWRVCFPPVPPLRLLLLPALAAAGTAYLVARNLPQNPDALPLSPLLFVGQLWWHWGGFEACAGPRTKPC